MAGDAVVVCSTNDKYATAAHHLGSGSSVQAQSDDDGLRWRAGAHRPLTPVERSQPKHVARFSQLQAIDNASDETVGAEGSLSSPFLALPSQIGHSPAFPISSNDSLTPEEREVWLHQYSKSVKADEAATPTYLWDDRVWKLTHRPDILTEFKTRYGRCPLSAIRIMSLRRWKVNVRKSLVLFLGAKYGEGWIAHRLTNPDLAQDVEAGKDCLWYAMATDWWDWTLGSRPFFWRWNAPHQESVRDGFAPWVQSPLPRYRRPQPFEKDKVVREKVASKLSAVRSRKYLRKDEVRSLTSFFSVPKGDQDICMVYDASKSSLNKSLWAANFGLPTVETLCRSVDPTCWMGDLDIGEMFLNFPLHPDLQPFCGVDLKPYFGGRDNSHKSIWERWVCCVMGLKPSPFWCIKFLLLALETIFGDHKDPTNPFYWDTVQLNLPGCIAYDPSQPKLQRRRSDTDRLAAFIISCVDDMRSGGATEEACWGILHRVSSRAAYLGIQVATRKTRPPSPQPGPWAGAMVVLDGIGVGVKATQDKWDKTKGQLMHIQQLLQQGGMLDRKLLESYRGSLVYLQRTYPAITPYVKGFHLSIDGWRENRDAEGWKIPDKRVPVEVNLTPPSFVSSVPRLSLDVAALLRLFKAAEPPVRWVRGNQITEVVYSFGDASGSGYGRTFGDHEQVGYTHGVWDAAMMDQTSNY